MSVYSKDKIERSYKQVSTILNSLDALVYVTDMNTHEILFINDYGKNRWGDIVGKICWKALQKGQAGQCEFCTNDKLLDSNGNPAGVVVSEILNTLDHEWYECRDMAIPWIDGRIVRLEIATNITKRKNTEIELRRLSNTIKEKNKELEHIIYITSHDLRSPLINIHGFMQEMEDSFNDLKDTLSEENISGNLRSKLFAILDTNVQEAMQYINASTKRIDTLINGMLSLFRTGNKALAIENIDVNKMISRILDTLQYKIKEKNIIIDMGDLPPCSGDKAQISHVFTNLLDNAIKYLDPKRRGHIKISGKKDNNSSIYCFADNGIGISPEYQEKIFELFYQAKPDPSKGLGIGMTIVQKILSRHDGKIWLESEPGKGSKFYVSLPAPD